jgi:hypothetical protein
MEGARSEQKTGAARGSVPVGEAEWQLVLAVSAVSWCVAMETVYC